MDWRSYGIPFPVYPSFEEYPTPRQMREDMQDLLSSLNSSRERPESSTNRRTSHRAAKNSSPPPPAAATTTAVARTPPGPSRRPAGTTSLKLAMEDLCSQLEAARRFYSPYLERFDRSVRGVSSYADPATLDRLWRDLLERAGPREGGADTDRERFGTMAEDVRRRLEQAKAAHEASRAAAAAGQRGKSRDAWGVMPSRGGGDDWESSEERRREKADREQFEMEKAVLFCGRILALAGRAESKRSACAELVGVIESAIRELGPKPKKQGVEAKHVGDGSKQGVDNNASSDRSTQGTPNSHQRGGATDQWSNSWEQQGGGGAGWQDSQGGTAGNQEAT
ncbi:hypothetical protein NKR23_g2795 [Pleurostoma richardsiae]|uniref:Uncharacterized protein n=1 Tax=Pleurostoma richardsiae TaxID=41990 RepID=A0AA38S0L1_9PEZI|nr:hypothetical protein NKR23_g2795 [Pleurostoma richardsiae]